MTKFCIRRKHEFESWNKVSWLQQTESVSYQRWWWPRLLKLASLVLLVAESSRDKNFQKALNDRTRKNSNIGFEYPKKSLHNSSYQKKKYLPKFSATPKNPEIKNFKPKKILRSSLSLAIRSTPPPPGTQTSHKYVRNIWIE